MSSRRWPYIRLPRSVLIAKHRASRMVVSWSGPCQQFSWTAHWVLSESETCDMLFDAEGHPIFFGKMPGQILGPPRVAPRRFPRPIGQGQPISSQLWKCFRQLYKDVLLENTRLGSGIYRFFSRATSIAEEVKQARQQSGRVSWHC